MGYLKHCFIYKGFWFHHKKSHQIDWFIYVIKNFKEILTLEILLQEIC